jgi:hypothetical protein
MATKQEGCRWVGRFGYRKGGEGGFAGLGFLENNLPQGHRGVAFKPNQGQSMQASVESRVVAVIYSGGQIGPWKGGWQAIVASKESDQVRRVVTTWTLVIQDKARQDDDDD